MTGGSHALPGLFVEPCIRAAEFSLEYLLNDQAVFFADRLCAELPEDEEAFELLLRALLQNGEDTRAHALLQARKVQSPQLRYLKGLCCLRLDRPLEAESSLLGLRPQDLDSVAGGGPGLFLLGQAKERQSLIEEAIACYSKCLEVCPFMWCAYERLSCLSLASCPAAQSFPSSPKSFAGACFCESKLMKDSVLNPCDSPDLRSPKSSSSRLACSLRTTTSVPLTRKRRRSDALHRSYEKAGDAVLSHRFQSPARSAARIPLLDCQLKVAEQMSSTPEDRPGGIFSSSMSTPPRSAGPLRTPMQIWSCISPRRLLSSPRAMSSSPLSGEAVAEAEAEAQTIPEARPESSPERYTLGSLLRALGQGLRGLHSFQCKKALEAFSLLTLKQQSSTLVQDLKAKCHFEMAEYDRAAEIYSKCSEHCFGGQLGLEYYSSALWHRKEAMKLGSLAQKALSWDRKRPEVWCAVGNCFSLQKERQQAMMCFRRAIQINPAFPYAFALLGHELADCEQYDKAIQMYESAIAIDSRHYNSWWGLGNVYLRQEDFQKAKYHFQRAVDINGCHAVLRTSLGMAWQALGKNDIALELFSAAAMNDHCGAMASLQRGCLLTSLGRHAEAISELRRAQGLAPREPCVSFQLGRAYAGFGDKQKALFCYSAAMDLCGTRDSKDFYNIVAAQAELLNDRRDPLDPEDAKNGENADICAAPSGGMRRQRQRQV